MDCNFAQKSNDLELSNTQKIKLRNWVSKNPNWKSIDDLPNNLFDDLVDKAGGNIDKRVAIQMKAIKFMKTLKNKKKGSGYREGFNLLDTHLMGKTYPELIESNLLDLDAKVKDLKDNNYNMSAIMDVQTYSKSIEHWAKLLEKEVEE
jgi:hypothetical protein